MKHSVYISVPVKNDWDTVLQFREELKCDFDVHYWPRQGPYYEKQYMETDLFVLLLPENKWSCRIKELPAGCKKELLFAISTHKSIFIGYKTNGGNYNIYNAEISSETIRGELGTSGEIFARYANKMPIMEVPYEDEKEPDFDYKARFVNIPDEEDWYICTLPRPYNENLLLLF